jgi:hypothetical protein
MVLVNPNLICINSNEEIYLLAKFMVGTNNVDAVVVVEFCNRGIYLMFLLVLLIVTVSFFLKRQALHKERARKINDYLKSFHQLNDSLKTAIQTNEAGLFNNNLHIRFSFWKLYLGGKYFEKELNKCVNKDSKVGKHRYGPTGVAYVTFFRDT